MRRANRKIATNKKAKRKKNKYERESARSDGGERKKMSNADMSSTCPQGKSPKKQEKKKEVMFTSFCFA